MDINVATPACTPTTKGVTEEDTTLVCVAVHCETHDVKTFTFASANGKAFTFAAGQYFTFDLVIEGQPQVRCYSISSSPHHTKTFSITVKRVVGGKASNWLHDHLETGATLTANGPFGIFTRPQPAGRKLLMLSGGSGITPMMSMLRDIADSYDPSDVVFIHAARTPQDIIFHDELLWYSSRLEGLRLYWLPEQLTRASDWQGFTGRLSAAFLSLAVPDIAERVVLCCGPAPFMAAARNFATQLGVHADDYREERFDAPVDDQPQGLTLPTGRRVFQVSFSKQSRCIEVDSASTILSAAKRQGVFLPSSCANGVCGSCKSKLLAGTVDMQHLGGIRQREIDAGFFLPCCSRPLSDVVIDR